MLAVKKGNTDCVSLLLNRGADPQARDHDNRTILQMPGDTGAEAILQVRRFVEKGCRFETPGTAVSDIAADGTAIELLGMLEKRTDLDPQTLLWTTAAHNPDADVFKALHAAGAKTDVVDILGMTPLHWAATHGAVRVAKLLLDTGADPNAADVGGKTPLAIAQSMSEENPDLIALLKRHDATE